MSDECEVRVVYVGNADKCDAGRETFPHRCQPSGDEAVRNSIVLSQTQTLTSGDKPAQVPALEGYVMVKEDNLAN